MRYTKYQAVEEQDKQMYRKGASYNVYVSLYRGEYDFSRSQFATSEGIPLKLEALRKILMPLTKKNLKT